jgi:hypothetical protein
MHLRRQTLKYAQWRSRSTIQLCMLAWLVCTLLAFTGCKAWQINKLNDRVVPSNNRDWSPEFKLLSTAEFNNGIVTIKKIRNVQWLDEKNYVFETYDREFPLSDIQTVDFIVVPFQNMPAIAHTMLSFELKDGTYITLSAEIRTERGEEYSPILGISNQFELIYVLADERDLIRLRTRHRDADVYVYPTVATAEKSQELFVSVMTRANQLAEHPEFYDTFKNNCTNNIVTHVNTISSNRVPFSLEVLLPGMSDRYAYNLGLLPQFIGFERLKKIAHINALAETHFDSPDFSTKIRSGQVAVRQRIRQAINRPSPF